MTKKILAPWTPEQVAALNEFQRSGGMHPFTCGHEHPAHPNAVLEATRKGWRCRVLDCEYEQDWAHAFMADPVQWPQLPFGERHGPTPEERKAATEPTPDELTAEEARALVDDLGLDLYRAQDALAFVGECCDIADREQRTITTADVREWLKGDRCGRQIFAEQSARTTPNNPVTSSDCLDDPRQPAYDAVYAYLRRLDNRMPADPVHRNAIIWHAVNAALDGLHPAATQATNTQEQP